MIQTAEQIIETVRALPISERKKFFELLEVEKNKESNNSKDSVSETLEIPSEIK